jgi:hypothetical protein
LKEYYKYLNKKAIDECIELNKLDKLKEKIYICNLKKDHYPMVNHYPDMMKCSMKEK